MTHAERTIEHSERLLNKRAGEILELEKRCSEYEKIISGHEVTILQQKRLLDLKEQIIETDTKELTLDKAMIQMMQEQKESLKARVQELESLVELLTDQLATACSLAGEKAA